MLPTWRRGNKPISIPISRRKLLVIPNLTIPLLVLLIIGIYFLRPSYLSHSGSPAFPTFRDVHFTPSKFRIDKSLFLPPAPPPPGPSYLSEPLPPKEKGMVVPDVVHYIYGLKPLPEGTHGEELPFYAYLAMRSAMINLRPAKIYFHYLNLPTGPWWDLLEPHLTLIKTEVPDQILGRPLTHFAHKADVLRLLAMKHTGGIYLDIDIFIVKPFDDLLYFPTTLGMEASPDSRRTPLEPQGLCNAIIISAPNAPFITRWLASYSTFDSATWAHHSVVVPWELAREAPDEVQVLNSRAFFWPMWHGEEIMYTHERDDYDFKATGQYAYHAWESLAMRYLEKLSPESIRKEDSSFHRLVRPFLGPNDDEVYRKWKAQGERA